MLNTVSNSHVASSEPLTLTHPAHPDRPDRMSAQFLETGTDYVVSEALIVVKDLLRRFPERADDCILAVSNVPAGGVGEPAGRAAYVFILGEYGHILPEAPYALETMLEEFAEEESPQARALRRRRGGAVAFSSSPPATLRRPVSSRATPPTLSMPRSFSPD